MTSPRLLKNKESKSVLCYAQFCPILCDPVDYRPPGSSVHGDSPGKNTGVGCHALLQGIFSTKGSNPGPRFPTLQGGSLPSEPPGKPKNTGVGNLSLLQESFPTQESTQGLLHCRQILYYWVTRESWWVCTKEIQLKVESLILKTVGLYENLHPEHLPSWVGRVAARL